MLERLSQAWRGRVDTPARRALLALFFGTLFVTAHVARIGTPLARIAGGAALLAALATGVVRWWRQRRDWKDPRRTVGRILMPTDRQLGERALRALKLIDRTNVDQNVGSPELAGLHLERLIARVSVDSIERSAKARASRWRFLAFGLVVVGVTAFAAGPMRVIEGLDVLVAWKGRGPLPMTWLEFVNLSSQPPAYILSLIHI